MARGNDTTAEIGVGVAKVIFSRADWLFREQPVQDYGIDAHGEPKENDHPTGQLIGLQIKTGPSFFKHDNTDSYTFYGEMKHLDYWTNHCLPVFIILHHPEKNLTLWQKVEARFITFTDKAWKIDIPKTNILDGQALSYFKHGIAADQSSFLRSLMAIDYPLMRNIRKQTTFMKIIEFNHKSLNMRGAGFYFDNPDKSEPDIRIERWLPHSNIHNYMAERFPWVDYSHARKLKDPLGETEGEEHVLEIKLNGAGLAFATLEEFYQSGPMPKDYDLPYDESDTMDDDEMDEWAYRHAMSKD